MSVFAVSMTIGTPDSARIWRHTSIPSEPGSIRSSKHQVGPGIPENLDRLVAVGDKSRLEPLTAKHDPEHLGEGGVVIDDEHSSFHGPHRSM